MTVYSHSRLATFENCRLRYKYGYIDRIRSEEEGVEAFLGKRFHEVMEKLYREIQFKTPTCDDLLQTFDTLWARNWNDDVLIVRKDRTPADYRAIGHRAVESYHQRYSPFQEGRVLGIERRVVIDKTTDANRPAFARRMSDMGLWDVVTDINWNTLKKIARSENWEKGVPEGLKEFVRVEPSKKVSLSARKGRDEK